MQIRIPGISARHHNGAAAIAVDVKDYYPGLKQQDCF
jgi:hypothetical protein